MYFSSFLPNFIHVKHLGFLWCTKTSTETKFTLAYQFSGTIVPLKSPVMNVTHALVLTM